MLAPDWLAECQRRERINEGVYARMYYDSLGIPTIGIGFNLRRSDAGNALQHVGVEPQNVVAVMNGLLTLTDGQISRLFEYSFNPVTFDAYASLDDFPALSDARRFVVCDLIFNLGQAQWLEFVNTRRLIDEATAAHLPAEIHRLFGEAADHLAQSAWYGQVGNRAKRDVAMLRSSNWCDAQGDGSL